MSKYVLDIEQVTLFTNEHGIQDGISLIPRDGKEVDIRIERGKTIEIMETFLLQNRAIKGGD